MDRVIDSGVEMLNAVGQMFCSHAWSVFVQVSVLIAALLALDLLLRQRVRAVVRYAMWMLVFVKLLLPPTLSLPTSIGYYRPEHKTVSQKQTEPVVEQPAPIAEVRPVRREPVVVLAPAVVVSHADVVPAPAAPAAVRPAITWRGWVFLGWFAGVLTLSVYLLRRVQYVRKLIRRSTPASDALADVLTQCAAVLRLRSCPALRLSDDAPGPAVCGLFRPVVLMPTSLAEGLHGERLRTVLVHELAHVRRADLWVNFAQTLLLVVYFYHPLLWLANAIVRRLREQAVDETVLVALDAEAESYGTTLIDLAEMTFHRPALGLRLIGIAESKKALEGRIRHMITQPKPRTAKLGLAGLLAIALAAAVLLPMARAKTEAEKPLFIARLSNGVTAELLGVCNWPNERSICWKPDGSPLAPPLQATKSHVVPASNRYGFMLRVAGPDDLEIRWNTIEGADSWEGSCDVVTIDGMRLDDCTAAVANMKAGQQQTALRVGLATGPWSTISSHDGKRMNSGGRSGVLWSQAFADSAGTYVVATAEWLKDRTERIIAIDADGVIHAPPGGSVASGNMDQMTTRFPGLKPDQVREFQYQVRPYEWAQFKNVSLRAAHKTVVTVEPIVAEGGTSRVGDESARPDRDHSRAQLSALGRTLLIYANDHDDKLPGTLAEVQDEIDQAGDLSSSWVQVNVAYLGRGMTVSNEPDDPVAYDKTLYERGGGTNVLHLDTSVAFESPERLEELGIAPDEPSPAVLRWSARRLRALGRSLIIYAKDHADTFPDTLDDLQSDRATDPAQRSMEQELALIYGDRYAQRTGFEWEMDARLLPWYREHVQYLGKGVKANDNPARVLAYDQTLLAEGKGTNVLHVDATVDFVSPERFKELMPAKAAESLPDIFILSPSRVGFNVFDAINSRTQDWTWNKAGRYHAKEAYDEIFDGTHHRTSHDLLVLVFTLDSEDRIPAGYEDLLPMPWDRIEQTLRQGQTVEVSKETRGLHVILLAAPAPDELKRLIAQSKLLADSKNIARSAVTGCDVAIEDFKLRADPDLGTFAAIVSIRNRGVATCPKIAVHFYRGDPEIATPMMHGAGPLEPGQTWNEVSSQFALREGANEVHVVLDPGNLVAEPDETNNRATLRVVIRDGRIAEQSIVPAPTSAVSPELRAAVAQAVREQVENQARATVMSHLKQVALAAHLYASDNEGVFPDTLEMLEPYLARDEGLWVWVRENVEYTGKGLNPANLAERGKPIAYSRLASDQAVIAFVDGHVEYVIGPRLKELGIEIQPGGDR